MAYKEDLLDLPGRHTSMPILYRAEIHLLVKRLVGVRNVHAGSGVDEEDLQLLPETDVPRRRDLGMDQMGYVVSSALI